MHFLEHSHPRDVENFLEKIGKRYQLKLDDSQKLIGTLQVVKQGDFGFVTLKENKIKTYIILSTLTNITNARAALFYKKNYSINRIALAEQLFGIEAKKIIKLIDTEIFLKHRESCRNFNGLCFLDCHRADSTPCLKKYSKHFIMPQISEEKNLRDLYNFIRWGTRTIKIGRSPLYQLTNLLFFEARTLIELIKNSKNEEEFVKYALKFTKEYSKVYKKFTPRYGVF